MPAMNCARPPQNIAMPTTAFGATTWRVPALNKESINVVDAKEKSPLKRVLMTDFARQEKHMIHTDSRD